MYIYEVYENYKYYNCIDDTTEHRNVNDIKKYLRKQFKCY